MSSTVECPICHTYFASSVISAHVNSCLNDIEEKEHDKKPLKRQSSSSWDFLTAPSKSSKVSAGTIGRSRTIPPKINQKSMLPNSSTSGNVSTGEPSISIDCDAYLDTEGPLKKTAKYSEKNETVNNNHVKEFYDQREPQANCFFDKLSKNTTKQSADNNIPLASKMRPSDLKNFFGQSQAVKKNSLLHNIISLSENIPSMIFWGPPGCGKTTLAKIIGNSCKENGKSKFVCMSAISASVNDVKHLAKVAANDMKMLRRSTILFLDEIHRFNKLQQDTLLPHVESGILTLIGATTENPSFQVNSALLSRCRVVVLEKLSVKDIRAIIQRALTHLGVRIKTSTDDDALNNGNGTRDLSTEGNRHDHSVTMEDDALDMLANLTDGDARSALNGLQLAWEGCLAQTREEIQGSNAIITVDIVKEALQRSHILYDKTGEEHYNTVSAMIKSLRGSDADAALYWMTRMLEGGENPLFIARRLVIFASEDIGLADSLALTQAVSTHQACHVLGMPECALNLTHCVLYLAQAPKSACVVKSLMAARSCIRQRQGPLPPVPLHLRNASTKFHTDQGYGKDYKYSPNCDGPENQEYLPSCLKGIKFVPSMK